MMCYKREQQNPIGLLYNITKTKKKKNTTHSKSLLHIRHSFIERETSGYQAGRFPTPS